jgi:hypothetical protein
MALLLQDIEIFAGYKVVEKVSRHHDGVREVYRVYDAQSGQEVALTVFNLKCE